MLVGFHVEGYDFLILKAMLARLLAIDETAIEVDRVESGMGWHQVLETLPKALSRFYYKCCALAVVGVDNDGNGDLVATGAPEDPKHPRHWLHSAPAADCRHCGIEQVVASTRPALHWLPDKPGRTWPVVVSVPVETIESWLLVVLAVAGAGTGSHHAERERRADQKWRVYGRPEPTLRDVEEVALPLIRSLTPEQIVSVRESSRSFDVFAAQVDAIPRAALGRGCWPGQSGASS